MNKEDKVLVSVLFVLWVASSFIACKLFDLSLFYVPCMALGIIAFAAIFPIIAYIMAFFENRSRSKSSNNH